MIKTYVATKNLGKLDEIRAILAGSELELETYALYEEPVEGESSYRENAAIKARALRAQLRAAGIPGAVLADDSGIEVAALNGRPGVLSARYAGANATWPLRRERLLEETASVPPSERGAKFCCAMVLLLENGIEHGGYGEVEGMLTRQECGAFGFGYDPIFWFAPAEKTFAEMSQIEKNRISHRRRAAEALLQALRAGVSAP